MTVKLMLLKSGEDVIADVTEMIMGEGEERRVIGYRLDRPCVIKMRNPNLQSEEGNSKKAGFEVSLFPWLPLSKDEVIPIPADWLITLVEPVEKLKEMYQEDIVNYGNKGNRTNNKSNSAKSD
tara:strand:+ start:252 stop:620 length:369 start_codon:yes stop_codon:yes gene_type:complete